jgi:tetratricopeptide (TPR) repeat protein
MTAPAHRRRARRRRPSRQRRLLLTAIAFGAVILTVSGGVYRYVGTTPSELSPSVAVPEPPALDRVTDPAAKRLLAECRAAVGRSPRSAALWGRLGMAFFVHDYPDEALVCLTAAERLDPHDARWPYFQGLLLAERDPDRAIQRLQQAADLCADNPDTPRLQLAELLLTHGQPDKAAEQFQHVLQRNPSHARAHLGLGRVALMNGELVQGRNHLNFAVRDRRTQKAAHLLLAQIEERYGSKAVAEQESRLAASAPDDLAWPDPYLEEANKLQTGMKTFLIRANLLLEQRHLDACIAMCRQLLRDYPDSDTIWLTLGKALVQKRDFPAAQEALQKVLERTPNSIQAHFEMGYASYLRRDYRDAVAWYRKATELKPDFTYAYHDLGYCLLLLGDRAGAIEAFRAALRCQPDLSEVHRILGELLLKEGQSAAAFNHLRLAVQLKPSDAKGRQLLAQVLNQLRIPIVP